MASAAGIKMGGVFVEIGADPRKFFAAYNSVQKSLGNLGKNLMSGGGRLAAAGIGMAAPIVAAVRQGANFESTLLNIRASTGATSAEIDKIKASAMGMSEALGVGPTAAAQGMLELLKAGMSLDAVLGGAGKAAIEFAKVGEMDVGQAAVVMRDAMNVFGVSGTKAANTLSGAADASSTSIAQIVEAFSNVGATGKDANQTIETLSAAVAILGNNMVKGGDAGTALKSMMLRLTSGADGAAEGLASIGLSTESFRDADQNFLPLGKAMDVLRSRLDGLGAGDRAKALYKIFGSYGLKAATILLNAGSQGFADMEKEIANALPVSAKFQMMMAGLAGIGEKLLSALQRLAIAIADAVAPALSAVGPVLVGFVNGLTNLVRANPEAVAGFAKLAVAAIGVGGAMTSLGISIQVLSFGMAGIGKAAAFVAAPFLAVSRLSSTLSASVGKAAGSLALFSAKGIWATVAFATKTGLSMAQASAGFGTLAVNAATSASRVSAAMAGTALAGIARFAQQGLAYIAQFSAQSTALIAVSSAKSGATTASYFAGTISIISATVARAAEGNMQAAAIGVKAFARLGVAGATNALIAQQSMLRLAAQGGGGLIRLGAQGSTALATIGTTAISTGANAGGALSRLAAVGSGGLARIGTSAISAGRVTIASLVSAAATGIAQAGAMTVAWLGGMAKMSASAALSGVAMAAAFVAPFAAIGVAVAGAAAVAYAFKDQISAALSGVGSFASQAGDAIGDGFSTAIADAQVVFSDLYGTATTTFSGISDALANGDLSGAMEILWAGLVAGWLRGVEALMSYVDPWLTTFQNAFTILGAEIAIAWDGMVTALTSTEWGATLLGVVDNIVNGVMAAFDGMVAAVRKSWNYVQSLIVKGYDLAKENNKVDNEMAARARERAVSRPGIEGRVKAAREQGDQMRADAAARADAMRANADATVQARLDNTGGPAADRRAATMAAEERLAGLVSDQAATKADKGVLGDVNAALSGVANMSELAKVGERLSGLIDSNRLSASDEESALAAYRKAAERLAMETAAGGTGTTGADSGPNVTPPDVSSKVTAAGTFSSLNLGQMFGGTSLAERTAKAAEETAKNTRKIGEGDKVAA